MTNPLIQAYLKESLAEASPFETTTTVDWGSGRGRGRRSGGGVKGAMADPPRGKKTYTDPVGALNLSRDDRLEVTHISDRYGAMDDYVQLRAAGKSHDQAMTELYERFEPKTSPPAQAPPERKARFEARSLKGTKWASLNPGDYTMGEGYGIYDKEKGEFITNNSGKNHPTDLRTKAAAAEAANSLNEKGPAGPLRYGVPYRR